MVQVKFVSHQGLETVVNGSVGESIMDLATDNNVEGIVGECGGSMACASCHCYVDDAWSAKTGEVDMNEDGMLDGVYSERKPTSRLSCQIELTDELDGVVIHLPEAQI